MGHGNIYYSFNIDTLTFTLSAKSYKFHAMQPNTDPDINARTIGEVLLKARGFFTEDYLFWVCIGALFGFSILFNILFITALTFLNRKFSHLYSIVHPTSLTSLHTK